MRPCLSLPLLVATTALATSCGSSNGSELSDGLPRLGKALYYVDYIGSSHDTTYTYEADALAASGWCILLQSVPSADPILGTTKLFTSDQHQPVPATYPLRGLTTPVLDSTLVAYSIYNGYSSDIAGSIEIIRSTTTQLGGTFDFSAPTVNQTPDFTVRIHGAFLATNDPTLPTCF